MVDLQLVVPVGGSRPVKGHTHTVEGFVPLRFKAGEKWLEGFSPTYTYGFEMGDRLCEYLDEWVDGVWQGAVSKCQETELGCQNVTEKTE
jgi:hypothetical protein